MVICYVRLVLRHWHQFVVDYVSYLSKNVIYCSPKTGHDVHSRCDIFSRCLWNSCQKFDLFSHVFIKEFYLQISSTSYRHKLDSVGPVHQNQQQIRLNIHTCTIQRCYCKRDCLHRHLGIGIRLNLRIVEVKKKILQRFSTAQLLKITPKKSKENK